MYKKRTQKFVCIFKLVKIFTHLYNVRYTNTNKLHHSFRPGFCDWYDSRILYRRAYIETGGQNTSFKVRTNYEWEWNKTLWFELVVEGEELEDQVSTQETEEFNACTLYRQKSQKF